MSSASVAAGYWPNTPGCAGRFESHLATGEGPFLRTRDRGFLLGGELFILPRRGRLRPFGDKRAIRMIPALALLR